MRSNLIACAIAAALVAPVFAEPNYESYDGFSISSEAVLPAKEVHPSLWFRTDGIGALRAKATADDFARKLAKDVTTSPYLTMEFPELPVGEEATKEPVHKYYGAASQFAAYNAFMSWFAADDAKAERENFRARAVTALKRCYDGPVYTIDPVTKGSAVDEIYRGTWLQNYALAYDLVQPFLSKEDDTLIRERIAKEMNYLTPILFDLVSGPHNHLSKPAWGIGSMALTMSDHPDAKRWLETVLKASNANTRYYFSKDGVYREGSLYNIFSFINFLPFLYHYRNISGVNEFGNFKPAFEAPVLMRNGRGWMPNGEDSYLRPFPGFMAAAAYRGHGTKLASQGDLAGVLTWAWQNTDMAAFDASEKSTGFNYTGASWDFPLELVEFLTYDPTIKAVAPTRPPTVFMESGTTLFRNDWSFRNPAHRFLLFNGVPECDNHQHYDLLSFVFQADDQMMASDAGYSRKSYGEKIRKEWYLTPEAHNVVMVNGAGVVEPAESTPPTSRHQLDTPVFDFEEKEAPYEGGGSLKRAIAFPLEEVFVVYDRVKLPKVGKIENVFHPGRVTNLKIDGPILSSTFSADIYGQAANLTSVLLASGAKLDRREGEITYIKGDYAPFPYAVMQQEGAEAAFLQVHIPGGSADGKAPVLLASSLGYIGAEVALKKGLMQVHAREGAGVLAGSSLETDASLVCVARVSDGSTVVFVHEGTYIRDRTSTINAKFSDPATVCLTRRTDSLEIVSTSTSSVEATLSGIPSIWVATVNGVVEPDPISKHSGDSTFSVRAGTTLRLAKGAN